VAVSGLVAIVSGSGATWAAPAASTASAELPNGAAKQLRSEVQPPGARFASESTHAGTEGDKSSFYDALTAWSTFLLFVFTGLLWRETFRLSKDAHQTGERQAEATSKTLDIAGTQVALAVRQVDLAEKQHGLERFQFLATHRPRIVVRRVRMCDGTKGVTNVEYMVANVGDTDATIIEISAMVVATGRAGLGAMPNYAEPAFPPIALKSGESTVLTCAVPETVEFAIALATTRNVPSATLLHFIGYIDYDDVNRTRRRTAFSRQYSYETERFLAAGNPDPDLEYQD
jgi:hypothetical protein